MIFTAKDLLAKLNHLTLTEVDGKIEWIGTDKQWNATESAGRVMSVDEAEALYYQTHTCTYDDVDREQKLIEDWCNDMNIEVTD